MEIWSKCDICGRDIPVGELCYGLKKGNCICKNCCTGFENRTFTLAPMPTLTPPNETPPCYQPDGDGCAYQCYDGDDEPIDKCKECPLCYSDKQRHHTPPNEWVSVEDEIPSDDDDGLEFFCMTNATGKCGGVLPLEWEVATIRGKTVRRWKWRSRISPWAVTHWMKRPAPPGENNNVLAKTPNEPLTLEQLREMDGEPVWVVVSQNWRESGIKSGWRLVKFHINDDRIRLYMFDTHFGASFFAEQDMGRSYWVYRRPLEGEV